MSKSDSCKNRLKLQYDKKNNNSSVDYLVNKKSITSGLNIANKRTFVTSILAVTLVTSAIIPQQAYANIFDPLLKVLLPFYDFNKKQPKSNDDSGSSHNGITVDSHGNVPKDVIKSEVSTKKVSVAASSGSNIFSSNNNSSDILKLADSKDNLDTNSPNLYTMLEAEFAYDRGDINKALMLYKQQSFNKNATPVFERALSLSLKHENINKSLSFASQWQQKNPNHVPAWFYVAHLALQAHEYTLAGDTLSRILEYDPKADFSQILQGIYPVDEEDQRALLITLQQLNSEQNSTLSTLQAGLLLQFNEPEIALIHIDRALKFEKNNIHFIILKADILQQLGQSEKLLSFLADARKTWLKNQDSGFIFDIKLKIKQYTDNESDLTIVDTKLDSELDTDLEANEDKIKELYLYEIRYRLQQQSQNSDSTKKAWELLLQAHEQFSDDPEITLLASLVSLDLQEYSKGDKLLITLLDRPAYQSQAYFYLATSAERQNKYTKAKFYYSNVTEEDLVLNARKKVVAYELLEGNINEAIESIIDLRDNYPKYVTESYILQADILNQQSKLTEAKQLLSTANKKHPNNITLQFFYVKLLDNFLDYRQKYEMLTNLRKNYPNNSAYQLEFAQLLLSKSETKQQAINLAQKVIDIPYSNPNFDSKLRIQGLNILATIAINDGNYQQAIDYLKIPYEQSPNLPTGIQLLKGYQGMGDTNRFNELKKDLQQNFSYPKS